ncbi:MAG: 2-phospho-L-lactate guanylyltransferase [Acidimicrobiales bacterium]
MAGRPHVGISALPHDRAAAGSARGSIGDRAVLVPVKRFADAKRRLGAALSGAAREALARTMADRVLSAAAPLPVAVVCDDADVAAWARTRGALVVWEPGRGLNCAVETGVRRLADMDVRRVVVAHGDLPFAAGLADLDTTPGVVLVPDRHHDGTNVIELPADCGFRFSYGPGSFERHRDECERLGLPYRVMAVPWLSYDVDVPADLPLPAEDARSMPRGNTKVAATTPAPPRP